MTEIGLHAHFDCTTQLALVLVVFFGQDVTLERSGTTLDGHCGTDAETFFALLLVFILHLYCPSCFVVTEATGQPMVSCWPEPRVSAPGAETLRGRQRRHAFLLIARRPDRPCGSALLATSAHRFCCFQRRQKSFPLPPPAFLRPGASTDHLATF